LAGDLLADELAGDAFDPFIGELSLMEGFVGTPLGYAAGLRAFGGRTGCDHIALRDAPVFGPRPAGLAIENFWGVPCNSNVGDGESSMIVMLSDCRSWCS